MLEGRNLKHFGGAYLGSSNPKVKRPISSKRCMHLVVRSSLAKGRLSFLNRGRRIQEIINKQGRNLGVKIYRQANGGNHLHLIILPRSRDAFKNFVRAITGLVAREVLHAERGSSKNLQFWDQRPFSRIVSWGKDFRAVSNYLLQNTLEALGFIPYQPRKNGIDPIKSTA